MNELMSKLRILFRAEKTLFKAEAQRRTNSVILQCMALACVFVAIIFVNLGIFFHLSEADINASAAFWLAGGNLLLAVIPYLLSQKGQPGNEEMMVREIRDMAMDELEREANQVSDEVNKVVDSVKQFKVGMSGFGGGNSLSAALPLVTTLIDLLKKKK